MFEALDRVMKAKGNRMAYLRDLSIRIRRRSAFLNPHVSHG